MANFETSASDIRTSDIRTSDIRTRARVWLLMAVRMAGVATLFATAIAAAWAA